MAERRKFDPRPAIAAWIQINTLAAAEPTGEGGAVPGIVVARLAFVNVVARELEVLLDTPRPDNHDPMAEIEFAASSTAHLHGIMIGLAHDEECLGCRMSYGGPLATYFNAGFNEGLKGRKLDA